MEFRRATPSDLPAIVLLDERVLARHDVIPVEVFATWQGVNPDAFQVLVEGDTVLGYTSVLALAPQALARFVAGEIDERDLGGDDLWGPEAARQATQLYFFSIARDPGRPELGPPLVAEAVAWFSSRERFPRLEIVYATAATDAGRRMLTRLGFRQVMPAAARKDGHALFRWDVCEARLSESATAPRRSRVGESAP